jgi:hypothetical protein
MRTIMPTSLLKAEARYLSLRSLRNKASRWERARRAFASFNLTRVVELGENWND